jgi:hypothetical protein
VIRTLVTTGPRALTSTRVVSCSNALARLVATMAADPGATATTRPVALTVATPGARLTSVAVVSTPASAVNT